MRLFSLLFAICTWLALSSGLVSSSEYALDIFGNANLDDRIDEADVAYIEGAVKGELQPTYLSDADGDGSVTESDVEQVLKIIKRNPDVIIKYAEKNDSGYEVIDTTKMQALSDEVLGRPELAEVSAVKSGQVYVMSSYLSYGTDYPALLMYWSKWLHPDIFADMDPEAIHREYLDRFTEKDYPPGELGSFVYP